MLELNLRTEIEERNSKDYDPYDYIYVLIEPCDLTSPSQDEIEGFDWFKE